MNSSLPIKKGAKVSLGMSGGVDSSLCAALLKEAGYDVTGVYLECWRSPGCRSEEDRKDALAVALQLGLPFTVLDFKDAYKEKVVEYFFDEYHKGKTPNPDVMCNKEIKFGLFYDWAMANGFDFVSTGHYAQVQNDHLVASVDEHKDQTYFLYRLISQQLQHILFPIGHLLKSSVRTEAKKRNILVADKKDSVGICFIGDINVHEFLKERLGENPGDVVDTSGRVIGKHTGLWFYTVGQRHGFSIDAVTVIDGENGASINKHNIPPFYVIKKIPEKNHLVVGFGAETYQASFYVENIHWIGAEPSSSELLVRIRHTGELFRCMLRDSRIELEQPIQGIAEGQSAVFYTRNTPHVCLGGGVIGG